LIGETFLNLQPTTIIPPDAPFTCFSPTFPGFPHCVYDRLGSFPFFVAHFFKQSVAAFSFFIFQQIEFFLGLFFEAG